MPNPCARDIGLRFIGRTGLHNQRMRVCKRVGLGLARTGWMAHNEYGELFLAFLTVKPSEHPGLLLWQAYGSMKRLLGHDL